MNNYELLLRTEARIIKLKTLSKELNKSVAGSKAILKVYIDQLIEETYRLKELCEKEFPDKTLTHNIGVECDPSCELDIVKDEIRKKFGNRVTLEHFENDGQIFIDVNEKDMKDVFEFANNELIRRYEEIHAIYKPEKNVTLGGHSMFMYEDDPIPYCEQAGIDIDVSLPDDVKSKLVAKMEASLLAHINKCKAFLSLVERKS